MKKLGAAMVMVGVLLFLYAGFGYRLVNPSQSEVQASGNRMIGAIAGAAFMICGTMLFIGVRRD